MSDIPPMQPAPEEPNNPPPQYQSSYPPKFDSNYPRQGQIDMSYVRPPGVYFDSIGIAWRMVQAGLGVYVTCALMLLVVPVATYMGVFLLIFSSPNALSNPGAPLPPIVNVLVLVMTLFILIGNAGLISVGVQHAKGHAPSISDFFLPFRKLGTVLVVAAVAMIPSLIITIGQLVIGGGGRRNQLEVLGPVAILEVIVGLISLFVQGPMQLALAHAVFGDVGPMECVKQVFQRMGSSIFLFGVLFLIGSILSGLGGCLCGIGALITLPILTNILALHYLYYFPPTKPTYGGQPIEALRPSG